MSVEHQDNRTLIIAEIGMNHIGDMELAVRMIKEAARAGADAAKFQSFRPENLFSLHKSSAYHPLKEKIDAYRDWVLEPECYGELVKAGREHGIAVTTTPFDEESALAWQDLGVPFFKVASGDLTHIPLLRYVGNLKTPIILSTGMATPDEIEEAIDALGHRDITLLQCTSAYPCPADQVDLRAMVELGKRFDLPYGLSDHTEGIGAAVAAAALGASVVEKHFTVDRALPGPDQKMSLDPEDFSRMAAAVRDAEAALGSAEKKIRPAEEGTRVMARRSLVAARDLPEGHVLQKEDIAIKRPGNGIQPREIDLVVGKRLVRAVEADEVLSPEDVQPQ